MGGCHEDGRRSVNKDHTHGRDALPLADDAKSFGGRGFNINTGGGNFNSGRQIRLHGVAVGTDFRGFSKYDRVDISNGKTFMPDHGIRIGK